MARTIYAFLVAIDEYFPLCSNSAVARNDIRAVAEVLRSRAEAAGDRLELRSLTDRDVTREGVISALRDHLGNVVALGGETEERPANYVVCAYDWRLSNRYNADRLKGSARAAADVRVQPVREPELAPRAVLRGKE